MINKEDIELNFPDQPDVYSLRKDNHYCLRGDYTYIWRYNKLTHKITIPNGFVYDGASVPRFLWSIFDIYPDGIHRPASLIHDYIYKRKGCLPIQQYCIYYIDGWISTQYKWTRRDADRLFFRILRESGVPKFKRRIMYYAVRLFGYFWWVT
jgi:hypothetical protein